MTGAAARKTPGSTYGKRVALCLVATLAIVGSVHAAQARWKIAVDQSQEACLDPYRWFLVSMGHVTPEPGQIVTFKTDGIALYRDGTLFTKKVLAGPGALVQVGHSSVTVDGHVLPFTDRALTTLAEAGAALDHTVREYRLGDGQMFVIGTNPLSYDSRYYGPVAISQVIGSARPLW